MVNFLLGIAFICVILPILENITSTICAALEILKAKCSLKISKYTEEIQKLKSPVANPIGFQYTPPEEDEYDED